MAIIGKAVPRSEGIVDRVAELVGCEPAVIDAIIEVEALADAFDPSKRLIVRPEAHKVAVCPYLGAQERKRAAKLGLSKQPKLVGYHIDPIRAGNSAWAWIDKMALEFGEDAAFWCASFGSPQIMGFNHGICKYDSPSAMVRAFADSEDDQIVAMGNFIIGNGLKEACRQRKWKSIAREYNGPQYAKNSYDKKLEEAYENSSAKKGNIFVYPDDDILEMGETGTDVRNLQTRLRDLGFFVRVDSDFGKETRDAVRAFQFRAGLDVTGQVGPDTRKALAGAAPKAAPDTPVLAVVRESATAQASIAQAAIGATAGAVGVANAIATPSVPTPTMADVEGVLKASDQGVTLATKIMAVGMDNLIIALAIGSLIFGAITLYRRLDAHYKRKIG